MNRPLTATLIAAALLTLTACGDDKPTATPSLATDVTPAATPTSTATTPSVPSPPTSTAKPTPSKTQPVGPQIVYFRVKTQPRCDSYGQGGVFFPGNGPTLEWKVTGADNVTISIDGPGIFGTYDTTYEHEFPFPCSGASGSTQEHKFTLRTVGGGPAVEQTLPVKARIN